jgi:pimeloyl-ACP methyl ester carboxylesterase
MDLAAVRHSALNAGPVTVFYREAGLAGNPVLLLLHGFANSSHSFRRLMPLLANRLHLIAPDQTAFGFAQNDSLFVPPGAEAFRRGVPGAVVKLLDAGHFALETNLEDIASAILKMPI